MPDKRVSDAEFPRVGRQKNWSRIQLLQTKPDLTNQQCNELAARLDLRDARSEIAQLRAQLEEALDCNCSQKYALRDIWAQLAAAEAKIERVRNTPFPRGYEFMMNFVRKALSDTEAQ